MNFDEWIQGFLSVEGVERSTMMGMPCLRYQGEFTCMFFEKESSLIIKVSPQRVNELIAEGLANEFNYTGKRFKEWVLVPLDEMENYEGYVSEAIAYAQSRVA